MPYIPNMEGYVFHGGYCVVDTDDGEQCGLMDKKGDMVLAREYDEIELTDDLEMWCIRKGKEMAVPKARTPDDRMFIEYRLRDNRRNNA